MVTQEWHFLMVFYSIELRDVGFIGGIAYINMQNSIYIDTHTKTHSFLNMCVCIRICMRICICTSICTYVYVYVYVYSQPGVDRIPGFSKIKKVIFQTHR